MNLSGGTKWRAIQSAQFSGAERERERVLMMKSDPTFGDDIFEELDLHFVPALQRQSYAFSPHHSPARAQARAVLLPGALARSRLRFRMSCSRS